MPAVSTKNHLVTNDERHAAEQVIMSFRTMPNPYELCHAIISRLTDDVILFETSRCLSHAILRDWPVMFEGQENVGKADQLFNFLLDWANNRALKTSYAPRQALLSVLTCMARREAASNADALIRTNLDQTISSSTMDAIESDALVNQRLASLVQRPSSQSNNILSRLVNHIDSLLRLPHEVDNCQDQQSRWQLGLYMFSVLLEEMSSTASGSLSLTSYALPLVWFQDNEMLRLTRTLLSLIAYLVEEHRHQVLSLLISPILLCLEHVTSNNFRVRQFNNYEPESSSGTSDQPLEPRLAWADLLGVSSLPATLTVLIKLYQSVRSDATNGCRALSILNRIADMTGPLIDQSSHSLSNGTQRFYLDEEPALLIASIFINHLSHFHVPDSGDRINISAFLSVVRPQLIELLTSCSTNQASPYQQAHEWPLLGQLTLSLVNRLTVAYATITSSTTMSPSGNSSMTSLISLLALTNCLDRTVGAVGCLLLRCITQLPSIRNDPNSSLPDEDQLDESMESLFTAWTNLIKACADSPANQLSPPAVNCTTTNSLHSTIAQLSGRLQSHIEQYNQQIFETFIQSKLVQPTGLRPVSDSLANNHDVGDDIDLDYEADDLVTYEMTLYGAALCGRWSPQSTSSACDLLTRLIDQRLTALASNASSSPDLYEDLHWLLLVAGHLLFSGQSLPSLVNISGELLIPNELLLVDSDRMHEIDINASRRWLELGIWPIDSLSTNQWPPSSLTPPERVPSHVRLLASLFRLLGLQVELGLGSPLMARDSFWLVIRIGVAYFCQDLTNDEVDSVILSKSPLSIILYHDVNPSSLSSGVTTSPATSNGQQQSRRRPISSIGRACLQRLLTCSHLGLSRWSSEVQVVDQVASLLRIVCSQLHSAASDVLLNCPAWQAICSTVCHPDAPSQAWRFLSTSSLTDLMHACVNGAWSLFYEQWWSNSARINGSSKLNTDCQSSLDSNPIKLFHSLIACLDVVLLREPVVNSGDSQTKLRLASIDSFQCALALIRGAVQATGRFPFIPQLINQLVGLLWNGLLRTLFDSQSGITQLCLDQGDTNLNQLVINLFTDVVDNLLPYLVELSDNDGGHAQSSTSQHHSNSACDKFQLDVMQFCQAYASQLLQGSRLTNASKNGTDIEAELLGLLQLLTAVMKCEFELRLLRSNHDQSASSITNSSPKSLVGAFLASCSNSADYSCLAVTVESTADVAIQGLAFLLPCLTESSLLVPSIASAFFGLLSDACHLQPFCLTRLQPDTIGQIGSLIVGQLLSGSTPNHQQIANSSSFGTSRHSIRRQCFELVSAVAKACWERVSAGNQGQHHRAACYQLLAGLGLDASLLANLLQLSLMDTSSSYLPRLESELASLILYLIRLNQKVYYEIVNEWLSKNSHSSALVNRIETAFTRLSADDRSSSSRFRLFPPQLSPSDCSRLSGGGHADCVEFRWRFRVLVRDLRSFSSLMTF